MHSNLSMMIAQEHQRDLRREAQAAKLARSVAGDDQAKTRSPRFTRISFVWSARRAEHRFAVES